MKFQADFVIALVCFFRSLPSSMTLTSSTGTPAKPILPNKAGTGSSTGLNCMFLVLWTLFFLPLITTSLAQALSGDRPAIWLSIAVIFLIAAILCAFSVLDNYFPLVVEFDVITFVLLFVSVGISAAIFGNLAVHANRGALEMKADMNHFTWDAWKKVQDQRKARQDEWKALWNKQQADWNAHWHQEHEEWRARWDKEQEEWRAKWNRDEDQWRARYEEWKSKWAEDNEHWIAQDKQWKETLAQMDDKVDCKKEESHHFIPRWQW